MTYINEIKTILKEAKEPISAKEISYRLEKKGHLKSQTRKPIDSKQIRDRIRKDKSGDIETIEGKPLKYILKTQTANLWVLKTVHEDDKASKTIDSYSDSLSEYYNYDNLVANSLQVSTGDFAILIDKKKILGFAKINTIIISDGEKTIRRCPECPSTTIDERKIKKPVYRCNKGHEFDMPNEELKRVKKYSAKYSSFISLKNLDDNLGQLRQFYTKGYNQNMSIQRLNLDALLLFGNIKNLLEMYTLIPEEISPYEGYTEEEVEQYKCNPIDERPTAIRSIKLRRGQQAFREKLLKRFKSTCNITDCQIVDILEAAHINPYRGENDNHISNGLL